VNFIETSDGKDLILNTVKVNQSTEPTYDVVNDDIKLHEVKMSPNPAYGITTSSVKLTAEKTAFKKVNSSEKPIADDNGGEYF